MNNRRKKKSNKDRGGVDLQDIISFLIFNIVIFVAAAFFSVVAGVIIKQVKEFPLELLYQSDVDHTSDRHYTGPGETTITYEYYVKNSYFGYRKIPRSVELIAPILFYYVVFCLIIFLFRTIKHLTLPKKNYLAGLINLKMLIIPLVLVLVFSSEKNTWAVNEQPEYKMIIEKYIPLPNSDFVYLIEKNDEGRGALYLRDNKLAASDSTYFAIYRYNILAKTTKKVLECKFYQDGSWHSKELFFMLDQRNDLWVFDSKDFMIRINHDDQSIFYPLKSNTPLSNLKASIYTMNPYKRNSKDYIKVTTTQGNIFYYNIQDYSISKERPRYKSDKKYFSFRSNYDDLKKSLEYYEYKGRRYYYRLKPLDLNFISPYIMYQDESFCIIRADSSIDKENRNEYIAAINSKGNLLWKIQEDMFPHDFEGNAGILGDVLIDKQFFILEGSDGLLYLDKNTGEVKHKVDYQAIGKLSDYYPPKAFL